MTDQEFAALAEDDARDAIRRAAHLTMLLAVEDSGPEFQREIHKLAIGDDADAPFVAQVTAMAVQIAVQALRAHPVESRREFLLTLIANNSTFRTDELNSSPEGQ